ncbi:unnamed protein product [Euphydryas editha]|uniref:CCHC-type domain-containing protein n=1 Tax=Euphydryas editha TaxID=104508 RepID=A0AAU9UKF4_EUPED|nr:unnamed protein product [Euphydryas editha]
MAGNYILNVPKLKGRENFDEWAWKWAFAVENFLILEGVDINKEDDKHGGNTASVDEQKAKAKLVMTIDPSFYVHIKSEKTVQTHRHGTKIKRNRLRHKRRVGRIITVGGTTLKIFANDNGDRTLWYRNLHRCHVMDMSDDNVGSNEPESAFLTSKGLQRGKNKVGNTAKTNTRAVKIIKCYKCKQIGHYKSQCPLLKDKQVNAFSAVFLNGNFGKNEWYIDSGASTHMINSQENIINVSHNLKTSQITVANSMTMPVMCSGETQITTVIDKLQYDIVVKEVLCVPNLTTNLLSVSKLIKNGNKVSFSEEHCYIRNRENVLIGIAEMTNGVYSLKTKPVCLLAASATVASDIIWHRRLGHINSSDMNIMKEGAVEGINYTNKADISKANCTVCCEGKQTRLTFQNSSHRSETILEVVHADNPRSNKVITSRDVIILEPNDSPEMTQVNISEGQGTSLGHTEKRDDTETDSNQSVITVIGNDDSTYVEEQSETSSSSDDFSDCLPMKVVKNLAEISQPVGTVRERKKPDTFGYSNMCVETGVSLYEDQITYEEAMNGPESGDWCKAMEEELKSFEENEAWEVVDKPDKATIVEFSTPMEVNLKLEKASNCSTQYPYQQLIGSLLYLSILTRPDILYVVCYLSQFNNNFNETHWKHVKRILKYLKKTKNYGLKYVKDEHDLVGYVDADWASNSLDRKSFTGFVFKMSGSVISYECKKQTTIDLSRTEAEYMAICEASKEAIYLRNLLLELNCRNESPILLLNDNQSAQK